MLTLLHCTTSIFCFSELELTSLSPPQPDVSMSSKDASGDGLSYIVIPSQGGESSQDSASPLVCPSPSNPLTAQDWGNHRRAFIELYQGKTLKETRALMAERYNFHATERMFKKRIAEWGLQKYKCSRGKRMSSNSSTSSETSRLRTTTANRLDDQTLIPPTRGSIDRALDVYTRSRYPNMDYGRFKNMSRDLRNVEIVLTQINDYYKAYSADMWTRKFPQKGRDSIKEIPLCFDMQMVKKTAATPMVQHPGELFNRIHMAAELVKMKTPETSAVAWRIVHESFGMLNDVVKQQHPQLLRYLFVQFWDHTFDSDPGIRAVRQQLFHMVAEYAKMAWGNLHPIFLIANLLPCIQDSPKVCELAWRRNIDTFHSILGAKHDENLRAKMALTGTLVDAERYDDCEVLLREVIDCFEPGSTAYYLRAALCRLAWVYTLQDRFAEAEPVFEDVLERCRAWAKSLPDQNALDEIYIAATAHLARIRARRDYQEGVILLQAASERCARAMGPDHAYTYTAKNELKNLRDVSQATTLIEAM